MSNLLVRGSSAKRFEGQDSLPHRPFLAVSRCRGILLLASFASVVPLGNGCGREHSVEVALDADGSIQTNSGGQGAGGQDAAPPSGGGAPDGVGSGGTSGVNACAGIACDDGVGCTVDGCDPATGLCSNDSSACSCERDEDCPAVAECVAVTCNLDTLSCETDLSACECTEATQADDCNDQRTCTLDRCIDFLCENQPDLGANCDDGLACSSGDTCQSNGNCEGDLTACAAPSEWACPEALYADDNCDCGCGAVDVDCSGPAAAACETCQCEVCAEAGEACSEACPVTPSNNAACVWECDANQFADGQCDCGCGALDPDCLGGVECGRCACEGGSNGACPVALTDSAHCLTLPQEWSCEDAFFADGECDCGCGALDTDCADQSAACEFCNCADFDGPDELCPVAVGDNTLCVAP